MHDFVSHILRQYFHATNWNEYNSYLHLTSCSSAILDFCVPTGLSLSISASPTPPFFTTYRLGALPNLRAGIGYIYASTDSKIDFGGSSKDVRLKEIIERFRIVEARAPAAFKSKEKEKEYYWLAGDRYPEQEALGDLGKKERGGGEYLVYGCMHVPSARLDALWTKRISPTWQLIVTAVSSPPRYPLNALQNAAIASRSAYSTGAKSTSSSMDRLDSSNPSLSSSTSLSNTGASTAATTAAAAAAAAAAAQDTYGLGPPGSTNLQFTLQRDTGRWFTEYSYSIDDALWGFRVLHNFGTPADTASTTLAALSEGAVETSSSASYPQRNGSVLHTGSSSSSEDTEAGGGLRGRFSAGAEVFISTVEKSAGLSTGIRFSTLPDTPQQPLMIAPSFDSSPSPHQASTLASAPSQPPTVITATLNPMMGHLSTAYAARMARDVVVCSRFDFNVYSYESEWTMGAEYWLRKSGGGGGVESVEASDADVPAPMNRIGSTSSIGGLRGHDETRQARFQEEHAMSLREASEAVSQVDGNTGDGGTSVFGLLRDPPALAPSAPSPRATCANSTLAHLLSPITGVLKARISSTSDIRLLWQGRLSHCLVSLGVKADLSGTHGASYSVGGAPASPKMGIVKSIGLEVMYFSQAEDESVE